MSQDEDMAMLASVVLVLLAQALVHMSSDEYEHMRSSVVAIIDNASKRAKAEKISREGGA